MADAVVTTILPEDKSPDPRKRPSKTLRVTWDGADEESEVISKRGFGLVSFKTASAHTTAVTIKVQILEKVGGTAQDHGDPDGDLLNIDVSGASHVSTDKLAEVSAFRLVQNAAGVGVTDILMS